MRNDYKQRPRPAFKGGGIAIKGMGAAFKKGGMAMDESMAHEGSESMGMESKETNMEKKGYMETKSGKMKKADALTSKMSKKKKGKMMSSKK
jgi:hypothetical protein